MSNTGRNTSAAPNEDTISGPFAALKLSSGEYNERVCSRYMQDFWTKEYLPGEVLLTCRILPERVTVTLTVPVIARFCDVKVTLWEEIRNRPERKSMDDLVFYNAFILNLSAKKNLIDDENIQILELRPLGGIVSFEKHLETDEFGLANDFDLLIDNRLRLLNSTKNTNVWNFRLRTRPYAIKKAYERSALCRQALITYQYPARKSMTDQIPKLLRKRFKSTAAANLTTAAAIAAASDDRLTIPLVVKVEYSGDQNNDPAQSSFTFNLMPEDSARNILTVILNKCCFIFKRKGCLIDNFVLKVAGREEYIFGDDPFIQFLYIQETLVNNNIPTLILKDIVEIPVYTDTNIDLAVPPPPPRPPKLYDRIAPIIREIKERRHLSHTIGFNYQCYIGKIIGPVRHELPNSVVVHLAVYHGTEMLCNALVSQPLTVIQTGRQTATIRVEKTFYFSISVGNLPHAAKLCFVISEAPKSQQSLRPTGFVPMGMEPPPSPPITYKVLYWANVASFDYKNCLQRGPMSIALWKYEPEQLRYHDLFVYTGTTVDNILADNTLVMHLDFYDFELPYGIYYPPLDYICSYAESHSTPAILITKKDDVDSKNRQELEKYICEYNDFYSVTDYHRKKIWSMRFLFRHFFPDKLFRLIELVRWNQFLDVWELILLLRDWPQLKLERVFQFLEYKYADPVIRLFAVTCLQLNDDHVILYLMQLIQGLCAEMHFCNALAFYLLKRALANQRIGHYLFWYLRSMINIPTFTVQFALMIETFLYGSRHYVVQLKQQLRTLQLMRACSEKCRVRRDREKAKQEMIAFFANPLHSVIFENVQSIIDPAYCFKRMLMEKCRVMDSKMRPLWLSFENADKYGSNIDLIFKVGDDLRQDMLSLQIIRVMDNIWKSNGYEYRMSPYQCIATDLREGIIEVVTNADTIANIQKAKSMCTATSAWKKESLYLYLNDYNTESNQLNQAVKEFTASCAGYSVVTYVLGIADRHSDNILLKRNGQLFHIDFGHFLGNFKEKFGIRRERTPFVLTNDFVYVFNYGQDDSKCNNSEFENFQTLCDKGFLMVRKYGSFIMSLFSIMKTANLPELSADDDLNFIKETFCVYAAEEDALNKFRQKFTDSLLNAWKTSLNWATHNMSKSNN